ncbi:hypothetical protein [Brevundimonas sp.]|uniref:hypothetical protein n=1 Tax=Brevundimonas sp. TaxID=1871086 RepID=UPI00261F6627|nr:hypothetical protein [Brevundimonas sp.]
MDDWPLLLEAPQCRRQWRLRLCEALSVAPEMQLFGYGDKLAQQAKVDTRNGAVNRRQEQ